jgi:diguanylate cyclase (GGDEF)-like protein
MQRLLEKSNRRYIIVSIIMMVVFIAYNIGLNLIIRNHYYEMKKDESLSLSATYATATSTVTIANDIADELLQQRIVVALDVIAAYENVYSNDTLADLADLLLLDEIYVYDSFATIVYSATLNYIGWQAYPGHPVYDFYSSHFSRFIEEIRKDTDSDNFYKYGYIKLPSGYFVQTGIAAERIYEFVEAIQISSILTEFQKSGEFLGLYYITNDYQIITSDATSISGDYLDQEFKSMLMQQREYEHVITIDGVQVYENFVHVMSGNRRLGVLALRYSLQETNEIILSVFLIAAIPLGFIYLLLSYFIIMKIKNDRKLLSLAYQDPVTGLNNRTLLKELLPSVIIKNKKNNQALVLINCRNFKFINQSFGFDVGDSILSEIGNRLMQIDISSEIFRFTSDRFVVYIDDYKTKSNLIEKLNKVNELFSQPFMLAGANQYLDVQIGIVEIEDVDKTIDEILKDASYAIDNIRHPSNNNYLFFNELMNNKLMREEKILQEIHKALENNDFDKLFCHFQPIVDVESNSIVSFEALARMKSEQLGMINPHEFIDIAERNQLITTLGKHILLCVCNFLTEIKHEFKDIRVSINVSVIELFREDFVKGVLKTLKNQNVDPSLITLEITESILFTDFEVANRKLRELQAYGIKIALDDFGMGYSSFNRLDGLNIDVLKIDKYFIDKINGKASKEVIVSDIISMAHKFDLVVVAEGVDQNEQLQYLQTNDCDLIQGYLFSKPIQMNDAILLLRTWDKIKNHRNSKNNDA